MRPLRDIPIKRKLTIINLLTSGLALVLACLAFATYELIVFRETMVGGLSTTAAIVADNSSAALTFNDLASAEQTLKSLNAHPHIVGAAVYDVGGKVFAVYRRVASQVAFDPPLVEPAGHRFEGDYLKLFRKIDLAGERAGTVYIQADLSEMPIRLRRYAAIVVVVMVAASFAAFLLSTTLHTTISRPISHLASVVGVVAADKNYSVRAVKQGEDELGQLIDGFNDMLSQIQKRDAALETVHHDLERRVEERTKDLQLAHRQLVDISRQAGMAEVATSVLHNVGNVLNSVNVSANLIAEHVQRSKASDLERVTALLRDHERDLGTFITADARGKHVVPYLISLSEHLRAEQAAVIGEIESLRANIEHIKDIVTMQQGYARVSGVKEVVNVADLVEDSLRLNAGALSRHGVEVVRHFEDKPVINIDKHKVLQILVNLIRNAKHACDDSGRADKRVTLRVVSEGGHAKISVMDNGVGIVPENLTRIFSHGFTTRKDGHGFGLHSGALAARELGGSLSVHSEGIGEGAAFTLELPLQPTEVACAQRFG